MTISDTAKTEVLLLLLTISFSMIRLESLKAETHSADPLYNTLLILI